MPHNTSAPSCPLPSCPVPSCPAIMIQGTTSDAGKSILAAALCRIFTEDGLKVAPFKAQNMTSYAYETKDGLLMGGAQAVQAWACDLTPSALMNPVLLMPTSHTGSNVIVCGKSAGHMRVHEYIKYKPEAFKAACAAYDDLAKTADVMVLEGAGSPAEINLRAHDIVNMNMAHYANAKVIIVGDIDRGGVFAALFGTFKLLLQKEQDRVAAFVVNKFRGDASLLEPAFSEISALTGRPFWGTIPHLNHGLPEEDSLSGRPASKEMSEAGPGSPAPAGILEKLDYLAKEVRKAINMPAIYASLGLTPPKSAQ